MKFNANVIITNPICHGNSGVLTVNSNVIEGTRYLWNTGHTSKSIVAFDGLEYWVNVESPQGDVVCINNISINQPPLLESSVESSVDSVSVISSGGTGRRVIKWQDSTTSSYDRGYLAPNTRYTYTITDSVGCTLINSIKTKELSTLTKYYITDSFFNVSDFDGIEKMNTSTIWLDAKSIQDIEEGDLVYNNNTRRRKTITGSNLYYAISDSSSNFNNLQHVRVLINQNGEIISPKIY
jgi:hypothetical protein